jgi:hypothetical protein
MTLEREKGTTPARRAMSASPSCQCIASAARHGTAISSATLDHISGLNLVFKVSAFSGEQDLGKGEDRSSRECCTTSRKVLQACSSVPRPIHFVFPGSSGNATGS